MPAGAVSLRDTFATTPYAPSHPRWCERYHHGHWTGHAIRFTASKSDHAECRLGTDDGSGLGCREAGCDPCDCCRGSPCSKIGDPLGNAVIMTTADFPGTRRTIRARFRIERQLPVGDAHLALYAALHPHCHTTIQAILVPDAPGVFHLNLAAFNAFIGGDRETYGTCTTDRLEHVSTPRGGDFTLDENVDYVWTLATVGTGDAVAMRSKVATATGRVVASGRDEILADGIAHWHGTTDGAARFAFGAQFSRAPSPSGGAATLVLVEIGADARD